MKAQPLASLVRIRYRARRLPRALDHAGGGSGRESAEVRTWSGESWRLAQPSFEIFYVQHRHRPGRRWRCLARPRLAASGPFVVSMSGPLSALEGYFGDAGPEPRQGHRQAEYITIRQGTVERRPLASLASLTFTRQPVSAARCRRTTCAGTSDMPRPRSD